MNLLDFNRVLNLAERSFLLSGPTEFIFTIRDDRSIPNFYEKIEKELRDIPWVTVHQYRRVKEGLVHVARPYKILITSEVLAKIRPEYLRVLKSFDEVKDFQMNFPLREFFETYFTLCHRKHTMIRSCLEIYSFLNENKERLTGLLPRQIPHSHSTKLIGTESLLLALFAFDTKNKEASWSDFFTYFGLNDRSAEFRLYAPECLWRGSPLQYFHGIISSHFVDAFDFQSLKNTLVIENLESFLPLVADCKSTLLIWGSGWQCLQLQEIMEFLPRPIYYWGDIDKEGIEIASQFIDALGAKTIHMDLATLSSHQHLLQPIEYSTPRRVLPSCSEIYEFVCDKGVRLEQEKLQFDWSLLNISHALEI